jgi:hypothetical protein
MWPADRLLRRARVLVLGIGVFALALKLWVAANTFGTTDVFLWRDFAQSVRQHGPVGIYGQHFLLVYNHAPLSGWMLVAINWMTDHGMGQFPFLIRVPASVADVITGLVVFELVRQRRSVREATVAASFVVLSPMLLIVSGFHGNTDPVFVMLGLLSAYCIVVRRVPILAGVAFGLALSVKLVPIVLLPTLLVLVARSAKREERAPASPAVASKDRSAKREERAPASPAVASKDRSATRVGRVAAGPAVVTDGRIAWRRIGSFVLGMSAAMVPLWLPVVLTKWTEFRTDVLGYAGVPLRQWGLIQLLRWAGLTPGAEGMIAGPGRFGILLICAGVPALLAWRRPSAAGPAVGLTLVLFLWLTPAFGMQYLSWAVAAAYLVSTWAASVFNVIGSIFMVVVYDHWNNALPWHWNVAPGIPFRPVELALQVPVWLSLGVVVVSGLRLLRVTDRPPPKGRPHVGRAHAPRPPAQQGSGPRP